MYANIEYKEQNFSINFRKPIDISIPMYSGTQNLNAFGIHQPTFEPFKAGGFIGSVALGGSVNCENLTINAHGNGTHTECVGHISKERITINEVLKQFMFLAQLISVTPQKINNDDVVTLESVEPFLHPLIDAIIIRTLPNNNNKLTAHYSGNNPCYLSPQLCKHLKEVGIKHLIIDLPSVDREEDGGALAAHHAFWDYPNNPRMDATITEMAFIPNEVLDDIYLLNLQIAALQTDASPSKPILYKVEHVL
ncbi:MAG: cyclase family protein [Bacteroidia bacterium]|nr:cyclase family protein [Bacteroidia bacterium]